MINLKNEFFKRFVKIDDHNELKRIAREDCEVSDKKDEKISVLLEENIKLVEDIRAKKDRIVELAIANNDLMRDYNFRLIDLQEERRMHKSTKIWFFSATVLQAVCLWSLIGRAKGWW